MKNLILLLLVACTTIQRPIEDIKPIEVVAPKPIEVQPTPVTVVHPGGTPTEVDSVKTPTEVIKVETLPDQVELRSDFSVKSTVSWIQETAAVANCVIHNKDFVAEVSKHGVYDYTKDKGPTVARKMSEFHPVIVSSYCKKPKFGIQVNAYRNTGSNVVYMNTCVSLNPLKDRVNTMIHERLHVVEYGHGDNSWKGKENTVPYSVGLIAEKYVAGCK